MNTAGFAQNKLVLLFVTYTAVGRSIDSLNLEQNHRYRPISPRGTTSQSVLKKAPTRPKSSVGRHTFSPLQVTLSIHRRDRTCRLLLFLPTYLPVTPPILVSSLRHASGCCTAAGRYILLAQILRIVATSPYVNCRVIRENPG